MTAAARITMDNSSHYQGNSCLVTSLDSQDDLVSPETEEFISKLKSAVIIPVLYLVGGPSNVVNIVVFLKLGLRDRVNVCLFSLALVDFVFLSYMFLIVSEQMFMFESHDNYGPIYEFFVNNKMMLFYSSPYASMFLSALIAMERCVCVLFPLQAKTLLSARTMGVVIAIFVPVITFLRLVVTAKYTVSCVFDSRRQLTYMAFYATEYEERNKLMLTILDGVFYGFVISIGCPIIVLIATVVTSVKLWQLVVWRRQASTGDSKKEIVLTKMLLALSVKFLIFSLPKMALRTLPFYSSEFGTTGKYRYFFLAFTSISESCSYMGCCLHFFVYYFAGSKYRQMFQGLFLKR